MNRATNISDFNIKKFQNDLIKWFYSEKRELPWRENQDPYRVWVSEIMLQQTKVDTVIPYYNRFMNKFPTIYALAEADEEDVLKAWEGLGYYSRARNLQSAVREVKERYDGVIPDVPEKIRELKGVGPYTSGAIASIAFGLPEPAVDGNVMRVLSRILKIDEDIALSKSRKVFEESVRQLISHEDPSAFNQGLMELGALICTPKAPSCLLCPVFIHCKAFEEGIQEKLPIKKKKIKVKKVSMAVGVFKTTNDEFLIHKRPSEGLLANLWEFPMFEFMKADSSVEAEFEQYLFNNYKLNGKLEECLTNFTHTFSHLKWEITVYSGHLQQSKTLPDAFKLATREEIETLPFPVPHQKIIKEWL